MVIESSLKQCPRCAEGVRRDATRCRYCQLDLVDPPSGELIARWIRSNPTLTLSLTTFLYVVFQIYKTGEFEVNTTVDLLRASGLTTILVGVLLGQLPIELLLLSLVACWWLIMNSPPPPAASPPTGPPRRPRLTTNDPRTTPLILLGALLVLSFYTCPWPFFLISTILTFVALVVAFRRNRNSRPAGTYTRRLIAIMIIGGFIILVQRPTTWAPSESVTTSDRGTIVGYVIADDGRWTTVLTPRWTDRLPSGENSLQVIPTDQIIAREPCAIDFFEARLLSRMLRLRPVQFIEMIGKGVIPQPLTPPCPSIGGMSTKVDWPAEILDADVGAEPRSS
jgi:hypothetical protein